MKSLLLIFFAAMLLIGCAKGSASTSTGVASAPGQTDLTPADAAKQLPGAIEGAATSLSKLAAEIPNASPETVKQWQGYAAWANFAGKVAGIAVPLLTDVVLPAMVSGS